MVQHAQTPECPDMTKTNNISAYQARNALQMTDTVNQNYLKITEEIAMLKAGN